MYNLKVLWSFLYVFMAFVWHAAAHKFLSENSACAKDLPFFKPLFVEQPLASAGSTKYLLPCSFKFNYVERYTWSLTEYRILNWFSKTKVFLYFIWSLNRLRSKIVYFRPTFKITQFPELLLSRNEGSQKIQGFCIVLIIEFIVWNGPGYRYYLKVGFPH